MSYSVYDSRGYIGDLASNTGLAMLRDHVESRGGPLLNRMFEAGHIRQSEALATELTALPDSPHGSVNSTIANLRALAGKCEDIIIITDGVFGPEAVVR